MPGFEGAELAGRIATSQASVCAARTRLRVPRCRSLYRRQPGMECLMNPMVAGPRETLRVAAHSDWRTGCLDQAAFVEELFVLGRAL